MSNLANGAHVGWKSWNFITTFNENLVKILKENRHEDEINSILKIEKQN